MSQNGKSHICPIDKRAFATKAALRQHRLATHQPALSVQEKQRTRGNRTRGNRRVSLRSARTPTISNGRLVSGSDIVQIFDLVASTPVGTMIAMMAIAPNFFSGTRMATEAALWSRWRPVRLVISIVTSAGSMTSGTYTAGWCADPEEEISSGISAITRVAAMRPSITSHVTKSTRFVIPSDTLQKWYLTNVKDTDDSTHGRFFCVLTSGIGNVTTDSKIGFTFKLDWTIQFSSATLPGSVKQEAVYADSDYTNYFTTSTSDWANGKYLILKAHSGGGCVPFPTARPQTVYRLDTSAKLNYKISGRADGKIQYGVRIPNFSVNTFAVFAEKDPAVKFASTGDSSNCLEYAAAGDRVIPDNPAWFETEVTVGVLKELEMLRDRVASLEIGQQVGRISANYNDALNSISQVTTELRGQDDNPESQASIDLRDTEDFYILPVTTGEG